jgi:hypothetical protein
VKRLWQRIKDEFAHQPLGSTYYLFMILGGIAAGVGTAITLLPATELRSYLWGTLFALLWLLSLTIPWLARRIVASKSNGPLPLNPTVMSRATSFVLDITKTHRKVVRRDQLSCLDVTGEFTYRFGPTGSVVLSARLLEPSTATLSGPIKLRSHVLYRIAFARPLEKNQVVDICLEYEVSDPQATMHSFTSVVAANMHAFDQLSQTVRFPQDKPSAVEYEVTDTRTDAVVPPGRGDLYPGPGGEYTWRLSKVLTSNSYWISWRW